MLAAPRQQGGSHHDSRHGNGAAAGLTRPAGAEAGSSSPPAVAPPNGSVGGNYLAGEPVTTSPQLLGPGAPKSHGVAGSAEHGRRGNGAVAGHKAASGGQEGGGGDVDGAAAAAAYAQQMKLVEAADRKRAVEVRGSGVPDSADSRMLAAVDMGTNSFHMVVVRADNQGRFQIEDIEKEDVRLGSGSAGFTVITPEAEERALAAMKRLKRIAATRKAEMRVVATSAVREARNQRTFVKRVHDSTGVEVEVLSGREEACLIYLGILQALPVFNSTVLTIDIGGGSTEFVIGREGKPIFATSLKLGHIRLTERFVGSEPLQRERVEEMRRFVRVALADSGVLEIVRSTKFEVAIGSSGTIEALEAMIQHSKETTAAAAAMPGALPPSQGVAHKHGMSFKERKFGLEELSAVVKRVVKAKTPEQRAKLGGLPEKRADVIVGGAVLLEEIFLAMGIQEMLVSPYALREGVIVDTLMHTCASYTPTPNLRRASVRHLAQKFNIDRRMQSALHSAELAEQLLDGLQTCRVGVKDCLSEAVTELGPSDREILEAATILHYVGMFISHKGHHKHSHYLIKNNEHLLGYTPMEIEMIALLAKYHRKKVPTSKDEDFAKLPEDVQRRMRALCAIIRLAVAFDRCDSGAIERVAVLQDRDSCILAVTPQMDATTGQPRDVSLEVWAATAELEYFEKIFKRKPSIVIAHAADAETLGAETSSSLSS